MRFLPNISQRSNATAKPQLQRTDLMRYEAKIGGQLFGPVPKGRTREFFCFDDHTWVWHEEWVEQGQRKVVTTRYDVRPNGVLKSQNGSGYQRLSLEEARNLYRAVDMYGDRVRSAYRHMQAA